MHKLKEKIGILLNRKNFNFFTQTNTQKKVTTVQFGGDTQYESQGKGKTKESVITC